jgi:hypothetical protein
MLKSGSQSGWIAEIGIPILAIPILAIPILVILILAIPILVMRSWNLRILHFLQMSSKKCQIPTFWEVSQKSAIKVDG